MLLRKVVVLLKRSYVTHPTIGKKLFDKILIANRGEIACRVIKTAKRLGIKTVAVYSDADAQALHVEMADEAIRIGPAPSKDSYLCIPAIMEAIRQTGAQAVHPGYGFLSENFEFVRAVEGERGGLVAFIGPPLKAMHDLGDKIESKRIAHGAGVNIVPGHDGAVSDEHEAVRIARDEVGFPVMIKASAGGGGKGIRIAHNEQEVRDGFRLSKAEAKSSFADDRLLIERYIEHPRHIEIQLIGDKHGNVLYLPERECSIQRRNQKVIEESPSTVLNEASRKAMGEQAAALARKVGYYSAGTVEFMWDTNAKTKDQSFYFLEMNTRLQVEHPITELITGLDLVELQILVAAGHELPLKQKNVNIDGWAVECRVYAEDPRLFLPCTGQLTMYREPLTRQVIGQEDKSLSTIRCDSGIREGSEISVHYDPMICKLCTWAQDRPKSLSLMQAALDRYVIRGVTNNIPLLREVITHPDFQKGNTTTRFLDEEFPKGGFREHKLSDEELCQFVTLSALFHDHRERSKGLKISKEHEWCVLVEGYPACLVTLEENNVVTVKGTRDPIKFKDIKLEPPTEIHPEPLIIAYTRTQSKVSSTLVAQLVSKEELGYKIQFCGSVYAVQIMSNLEHALASKLKEAKKVESDKVAVESGVKKKSIDKVFSPMPGVVVNVSAKEGQMVEPGQELLVVEAMKMQNAIRAVTVGKIVKIHVKQGDSVRDTKHVLIEIEREE